MPIYDSPAEDAAEHFDAVLDFIARACTTGEFLCTATAVFRSATFVVAHLMKARALDPAAALELVRAARPQAEPNAAFLKQLDVLHTELEASRKRDAQRLGRPGRAVAEAQRPPRRGPGAPHRRAGAPRPLATAPARPERAIGAPARPERAGPARRHSHKRRGRAPIGRPRRRRRRRAGARPRWNASRRRRSAAREAPRDRTPPAGRRRSR